LSKSLNDLTENKVNFAAFNIVKILGSGAFGKVFLATHIKTGKQYALKALKKKNLIMQKQLKYAIVEANVLKQANNPFIINLHFAFQTPHYLYLALDYCAGKDLSFHLAR
jgi:serine/threonine protein kinase